MRAENGISPGERSDALEMVARSPVKSLATPIGRAIDMLLPGTKTASAIEQLFDNRAGYGAIKGWRFGRRAPPQWATELVARKLRAAANPLHETAETVIRSRGIGRAWDRTGISFARWRARKAKEKAGD